MSFYADLYIEQFTKLETLRDIKNLTFNIIYSDKLKNNSEYADIFNFNKNNKTLLKFERYNQDYDKKILIFYKYIKNKLKNTQQNRTFIEYYNILGSSDFTGGLKSKWFIDNIMPKKKEINITSEFTYIIEMYKIIYNNFNDYLIFNNKLDNIDLNTDTIFNFLKKNFIENVQISYIDAYLLNFYKIDDYINGVLNDLLILRTFPIFHYIMELEVIKKMYTNLSSKHIKDNNIDFCWNNYSNQEFFSRLCFKNPIYTINNILNFYNDTIDMTKFYIKPEKIFEKNHKIIKNSIINFFNKIYSIKNSDIYEIDTSLTFKKNVYTNIFTLFSIIKSDYNSTKIKSNEDITFLIILIELLNYNNIIEFVQSLTNEELEIVYTKSLINIFILYLNEIYNISQNEKNNDILDDNDIDKFRIKLINKHFDLYNNNKNNNILSKIDSYLLLLGDFCYTKSGTLGIIGLIDGFINSKLLFDYLKEQNNYKLFIFLLFSSKNSKIIPNYNPLKDKLLTIFDKLIDSENIKIIINI